MYTEKYKPSRAAILADEWGRQAMGDRIKYDGLFNKKAEGTRFGKSDPRLVNLVRFLARRAAERDYAELLAAREKKHKELSPDEDL